MRNVTLKYIDTVLGRPDELYESPVYPINRAKEMAEMYGLLGMKVVEIAPYLKKDLDSS